MKTFLFKALASFAGLTVLDFTYGGEGWKPFYGIQGNGASKFIAKYGRLVKEDLAIFNNEDEIIKWYTK